jgi:hypothetical protein
MAQGLHISVYKSPTIRFKTIDMKTLSITIFIALSSLFFSTHSHGKINKSMDLCKAASHQMERHYNIPKNLLRAISLTETGRWLKEHKENIAWPWTVTSGGSGQYFPTKSQAIAHVRDLQAQGVTNIDVGCMQINMRYHPDAFDNLHEAFDPHTNTEYAGDFLTRLFKQTKSWSKAAAHYHSTDPERNMYYREKVLSYWNYANTESHETQQAQITKAREKKRVVPVRDQQRMALLNNSFRQKLSNQNKAMDRAEEMYNKISQYRKISSLSNNPGVNAARQQALYRQKNKQLLTTGLNARSQIDKETFAQRRSAQLEKWRKTKASPSLFKQDQQGNTTSPDTLLTK